MASGKGERGRRSASKGARGEWTAAKEEIFFAELAMVCNVSAALRAAGMTRACRDVYKRRKRDPKFRASWDEAIAESYALLELEMLERSRHGDNRPPPATPAEARQREIPTRLGLHLLKLHQAKAKSGTAAAQRSFRGEQLRCELERRLGEISRRLGGGE
jgi:hypothetical protein